MSREKGQTPAQLTKSKEKFLFPFLSHHHPPVISLSPLVFLSASMLAAAKSFVFFTSFCSSFRVEEFGNWEATT